MLKATSILGLWRLSSEAWGGGAWGQGREKNVSGVEGGPTQHLLTPPSIA